MGECYIFTCIPPKEVGYETPFFSGSGRQKNSAIFRYTRKKPTLINSIYQILRAEKI